MADDGTDAGIATGGHAFRLAERIAIQDAGAAFARVRVPPGIDVGKHGTRCRPAIDWEGKRGFRYERVAAHGFERRAGGIRFEFVVTRNDPDLTGVFDPALG